MDVNQLRTIIHVAELGSLSKAAERLHIAQPALSRQVRMLEDELGTKLFERHGRGMVATEAGDRVLRHAQSVMRELEDIRASVLDEDAPLTGHVSIGMPPTVGDILSVPLVEAFKKHHPDATLRIISAYSGFLLDWLQRREVDVAILFYANPVRSLTTVPLIEENLYLIGPANQNLKPEQPIAFKRIASSPLLLPSIGHGLRDIVESCAKACSVQLNVRVETDSYSTLKNLVKAGHGMTILPLAPIHDEISSGKLTFAPLADPMPIRKLLMTYPADRPVSRLTKFAAQVLVNTTTELVEKGAWPGRLSLPD